MKGILLEVSKGDGIGEGADEQGLWEEAARNPRIKFVNKLPLRFEDGNLAPVSYEV